MRLIIGTLEVSGYIIEVIIQPQVEATPCNLAKVSRKAPGQKYLAHQRGHASSG